MSCSSSIILSSSSSSINPVPLSWSWQKSSSSQLIHIWVTNNSKPKSRRQHICFTSLNNDSSSSSRRRRRREELEEEEERRWVREEQRWLREEQRWIREERRWEAEKQTLLNENKALKLQIHDLIFLLLTAPRQQQQGDDSSSSSSKLLLLLLKKEIADTSSPLLLNLIQDQDQDQDDAQQPATAVKDEEEEVIRVVEDKNVVNIEKKKKTITTLRAGSEGDHVQMLQEALLKLGFYCGEEDEEFATFSSGTERAVKTWQSTIGVPETGIVTPDLLQTLFTDPGSKEGANGVAANSLTQTPEIPLRIVKEVPEPDVSEHRVFLLGENRWEDSSRLKNQNSQTQPNSKGVVKTKCITCRGEGRLLCLECDGTGEPNIEPQFLEWVGEDTKCPYCEGDGHTICDVCQGTGAGAA